MSATACNPSILLCITFQHIHNFLWSLSQMLTWPYRKCGFKFTIHGFPHSIFFFFFWSFMKRKGFFLNFYGCCRTKMAINWPLFFSSLALAMEVLQHCIVILFWEICCDHTRLPVLTSLKCPRRISSNWYDKVAKWVFKMLRLFMIFWMSQVDWVFPLV